jgi:hypothetical protein
VQPRRETARAARHLSVAERSRPEPVVMDDEVAGGAGEVVEEIEQRVAAHP